MFIAHMPAAYLLGAVVARRWPHAITPAAWAALLLGSVAPDFDLLYFYAFSNHAINHHSYPPHLPIVWVASWALVSLILWRAPKAWRVVWAMFCIGGLLHLALDTIAGGIRWLWPWTDTPYVLMVLPRRFDNIWLNRLSHPSIALEAMIVWLSVRTWRRRSTPHSAIPRRMSYRQWLPRRPYRTFL
jgi:membrane-bound metal-dependent hydrolase YbcI (DUF457 family)